MNINNISTTNMSILELISTKVGRAEISQRILDVRATILSTPIELSRKESRDISIFLRTLIFKSEESKCTLQVTMFPFGNDGDFIRQIERIGNNPEVYANSKCHCEKNYMCFCCLVRNSYLDQLIKAVKAALKA